ncbi:MAG TPA: prepilin-type N-terminal cleavage/methylation domain-containing protein [Candidatus Saccharimonadales bacterium]|nr:prepilin-type N-terminal cleavage/methylation domain-containing protein [Candidatus Saccharimonadales bacterium]
MKTAAHSDQAGFTISALQQWYRRVAKWQHSRFARPGLHQAGFTIVELMVATVVSAIVVLVITFGIVHFTSDYYRGVNSSATQAATQNAIDAITQAIQFNATDTSSTNGTEGFFCAGSREFIYTLGKQPNSSIYGLYEFDRPAGNCAMPSPVPAGGTELLDSHMRLADIDLQKIGVTATWSLTVRVAYGDPDLLCSPKQGSSTGGCTPGAANYANSAVVAADDLQCKTQTGSQFCSVSALSTAIGQRVSG